MGQLSATEKSVQFATTVSDLPSAWTFVMQHTDSVGDAPRILISPMWSYGDNTTPDLLFEVSVSGMKEISQ